MEAYKLSFDWCECWFVVHVWLMVRLCTLRGIMQKQPHLRLAMWEYRLILLWKTVFINTVNGHNWILVHFKCTALSDARMFGMSHNIRSSYSLHTVEKCKFSATELEIRVEETSNQECYSIWYHIEHNAVSCIYRLSIDGFYLELLFSTLKHFPWPLNQI